MSCPDVHTVSSCLTPGEEKRCPAQQFLVVLSVTVETERKRELQQRPGLRAQWQEERGDDSRKQFRNRARACASQAVLSVVSCQRLMSTWSEKVGWFGHGKVKQQAGAEDAPKGNLRGTQTLQPHGKGLFPPLYSTFIFITKLGAFFFCQLFSLRSNSFFYLHDVREHKEILFCHQLIWSCPEAEVRFV